MTPGIIKKLYHTTPVGLTDEDKQEVYPITATSAVYSAPGESSFPNMSLDNILDALNQGYHYMGKASPTTNPGVFNHKVFYLASEAGTYSHFDGITVSGLTVLKSDGNGWSADAFNITGGGGGGLTTAYIGTTMVQDTPAPQQLSGISQLNLTSGARIYFGETAYIELNQYGFHFSHGIYSDSFVAAGGIGSSGGGGGGGVSNLSELDDVYHNNIGVLRADGTAVQPGDALIYNTTLGWVAAPVSGGGGSGTVTGVKMNGTTLSPSTTGIVDLGTVITSLSGYATEQWVGQQGFLTSASLSGYATQSWVQQQGYLTSFTETDPTVPAWAKAQNPLLYIGTTQVQTSSAAQDLTGILSVKASSANASKFEWNASQNAWHFYGNIYADGWVAAGGIGSSGQGGGSTVEVDNLLSSGTRIATLTVDGVDYDILAPSGEGTVTGIKVGTTSYSPVSGIVSLPAYPTTLPASDVYSWAKASTKPSYTFGELTSHPTTLSGYGITDAKIQNGVITLGSNTITPLTSVAFADLTSHPTTLSDYGITDAKISNGTITLGSNTITPLVSSDISTLTLSSGTFSSGSWTPTGSGKTFNIPTTAAHLSYGNDTLKDFLDDLSNNYVTIATTQTITGAKTFSNNPVTIASSSGISVDSSSYIDIGNARLVYDSGSKALHVTVKSGVNQIIGFFADGFVSAGGVGGQSAAFVDLESNQTIGGNKTFTGITTLGDGVSFSSDEINYSSRLYIQYNSNDLCLTKNGKTIIGTYPGSGAVGSNKLYVAGSAIATSWNTNSDIRLKDDIVTIESEEAINVINALNPVKWRWKTGGLASGLIAQEVEKIIPFMVTDGEYKGLAYQMLHAYEISAIQSHEERIKQLEEENKKLKEKLMN